MRVTKKFASLLKRNELAIKTFVINIEEKYFHSENLF